MSEHVPTVAMVMSKLETEQILVVVEASDTLSPEDAVGVTANDVADHARLVGSANVIVWLALTSESE